MACDHDLDPEYLHPSDGRVLEIYEDDDSLRFAIAIPCPECDQALRVDATVDSTEEIDVDTPFGDITDFYQ